MSAPMHAQDGSAQQQWQTPAPRGRGFAIAALAIAVVWLVGSTVANYLLPTALVADGGVARAGVVLAALSIVGVVVSLVVLALAIVSVVRREPARLLAGMAMGVAGGGILSTVVMLSLSSTVGLFR